MKTRLLKKLRRIAKRKVYAKYSGYYFKIIFREKKVEFYYKQGKNEEQDMLSVSESTLFNNIDELKKGLMRARRYAILEILGQIKKDIINKEIKNL